MFGGGIIWIVLSLFSCFSCWSIKWQNINHFCKEIKTGCVFFSGVKGYVYWVINLPQFFCSSFLTFDILTWFKASLQLHIKPSVSLFKYFSLKSQEIKFLLRNCILNYFMCSHSTVVNVCMSVWLLENCSYECCHSCFVLDNLSKCKHHKILINEILRSYKNTHVKNSLNSLERTSIHLSLLSVDFTFR